MKRITENFRRFTEEGGEETGESCPVPPKTVEVNGEPVDTQEAAKVAEKVMGSDLLNKLLKNPEIKAALDNIAQEVEQTLEEHTAQELQEIYGESIGLKEKENLGDMAAPMLGAGMIGGGCLVAIVLGTPGLTALTAAMGTALAANMAYMGAAYITGIAVGAAADYIVHKKGLMKTDRDFHTP